jgi:hypothetical protein
MHSQKDPPLKNEFYGFRLAGLCLFVSLNPANNKKTNMNRYITIIILIALFSGFSLKGISQSLKENIHIPGIRSVNIHKKGEPLSPAIIGLNKDEQITLSFDDMEGGSKTYSYKLIHCDANWNPSDLFKSDYISGQFTGEITHYQNSFNTLRQYTHYELSIPNPTMKPTVSGNYVIMVYANFNPADTVLTRKFRINENKTGIQGEVDEINRLSKDKPNQELNLTLQTAQIQINDPYNNLKIAVEKNYHNEKLLEFLNPSSMNGNRISYQMNKKLQFKGGNEFHHFNSKSTDYPGEHIETIQFRGNNFHFHLTMDKDRTFGQYQIKKDLNGRFRIDKENADDPDTEADYVYVHFTLKDKTASAGGNFYITGAFNNWKCGPENKMQYNSNRKVYQKQLLLKQGYYDFKYVYKTDEAMKPFYISGNYHQTENDYLVYIYYRDHAKGYDRLIGHTLINSSQVGY